jgi:uncharacterized protein (TIGR02757 family)
MSIFAKMKKRDLQSLLEDAYATYAKPGFIDLDPIGVAGRFSKKEDIEIAGFLAATIAWGQRPTIIKNANRMMELMEEQPHDFVLNHSPKDLERFEGFVHRTFNHIDLQYFIYRLQKMYQSEGGIEHVFSQGDSALTRISNFHDSFFNSEHLSRTRKHVSNPMKGSSAKRLNMYLRWMVRSNKEGIDFGIWNSIPTADLMMPLDVHTGNIGRHLGLLKRKQHDWKAVDELTNSLKAFDPVDPVRFDLALFGIGVNKMI